MLPSNGFTNEDLADPVGALCALIDRRCGFRIPKVTMEAMFMSDWSKLSTLAHAIHDKQQRRASALTAQEGYDRQQQ